MENILGGNEDPIASCGKKMKVFLGNHWRGLLVVLTPLISLAIILPPPIEETENSEQDSEGTAGLLEQEENSPEKPNEPEVNDGELVPTKKKILTFLRFHWRGIVFVLCPLICLPIIYPRPEKFQWCAYVLVIMAVYWVSECIPLPITSFLPVMIFPLTDVMTSEKTCQCYFNDTIVMFFGSLVLATAVEQCGLHKRLALCAIRIIGYSHYKLLFAMCFITMFASMWLTNTAATTMMVPINFALLKVFEDQKLMKIYDTTPQGDVIASDLTTCYFCAATFSATIGGIGTLVGTGTNLVFKGLLEKVYPQAPDYLSFPMFSAFAVPYMIVMEFLLYLCMILNYLGFLRPGSQAAKAAIISPAAKEAAKQAVLQDSKALGPFTFWEFIVTILFGGAMVAFFSRSPGGLFTGWADLITNYYDIHVKKFIGDSSLAMLVSFIMLLLPARLIIFKNCSAKVHEDLPRGPIMSVLDWRKMDASLPYSFMFLLGGGFALSTAAKKENSDLNGRIGDFLAQLSDLPQLLILFLVVAFTIFLTNFASNVAVANVVVPIGMTLAEKIDQNPLLYNLACGFSASYCFCLPVGTPGNLVVQSAAKIPISKMLRAGAPPTVTTLLITWVAICFWAPVVWSDLKKDGAPVWSSGPKPTPK